MPGSHTRESATTPRHQARSRVAPQQRWTG
nr:MAG TPA: hypothetical protein [Caudoviricetes sp.]